MFLLTSEGPRYGRVFRREKTIANSLLLSRRNRWSWRLLALWYVADECSFYLLCVMLGSPFRGSISVYRKAARCKPLTGSIVCLKVSSLTCSQRRFSKSFLFFNNLFIFFMFCASVTPKLRGRRKNFLLLRLSVNKMNSRLAVWPTECISFSPFST